MKKPFYAFAVCLFYLLSFSVALVAQQEEYAPYPYEDKKPEEKKTIGEKVKGIFKKDHEENDGINYEHEEKKGIGHKMKEAFEKDQAAHEANENDGKEKVSEDPIRFYEFEDITFANKEEKEKIKETHTKGEFKWVSEDKEDDYYEDVTFRDETEAEEETNYDDESYSPYKDGYWKSVDGEEKKEEIKETERPIKPIEIKDKDHYRQDYINYYYHRKKKGNGEPGTYPDYSDERKKTTEKIKERIRENRNGRGDN